MPLYNNQLADLQARPQIPVAGQFARALYTEAAISHFTVLVFKVPHTIAHV